MGVTGHYSLGCKAPLHEMEPVPGAAQVSRTWDSVAMHPEGKADITVLLKGRGN